MKGRKPNLVAIDGGLSDVPEPPDHLSEAAQAEWKRVTPLLVQAGFLDEGSLGSLENYCIAHGAVKECEQQLKNGHVVQVNGIPKAHPAVSMQRQYLEICRRYATELGLMAISKMRVKKGPLAPVGDNGAPAGLDI